MRWSDNCKDAGQAVTVNVSTRTDLLADIDNRLRTGQGFTLATLNLDHVTKLRRSDAFRAAYLRHSHVTADGNPIVWLARLAGQELSLLPGSELIVPIVEIAARQGAKVALFGATQASLAAAAQALEKQYPDLDVVASIAPPMGFDPTGQSAQGYIEDLRASGARVCFVALGAPKQEIFAAHASAELPSMGFLSIGAGLDFISGKQTRAPKIVRYFAAEWIWRLMGNPRRLARRYGDCIAILPGLLYMALRTRYETRRKEVT